MTARETDRPERGGRTDGDEEHSAYYEEIRSLAVEARAERRTFESPADGAATERANLYVRRGVGPVIGIYVEGRAGGRNVRFSETEFDLLHRALNDWLALYARCHGVRVDPDASIRTAAEALLQTHDAADVARLLTDAPRR